MQLVKHTCFNKTYKMNSKVETCKISMQKGEEYNCISESIFQCVTYLLFRSYCISRIEIGFCLPIPFLVYKNNVTLFYCRIWQHLMHFTISIVPEVFRQKFGKYTIANTSKTLYASYGECIGRNAKT